MSHSTLADFGSGGSSLLSYGHARVALADNLVQNLDANQLGCRVGGKLRDPMRD
jgi:hypothetical protein